jgi:nitrous oxidase accessory protein
MKFALCLLAAALAAALATLPTPTASSAQAASPRTLVVAPDGTYTDLAAAVAAARDGDTVEVHGGSYRGPIVVEHAVALVGVDRPVIDGGGEGTVVSFMAPGGRIAGFLVRGSGARNDKEDAGIAAFGTVTIEHNVLEDVLYGIDLQIAPHSVVADNRITGREIDIARRGDAMRLWESHDSIVRGNRVEESRDVVIWYSERVTVQDNVVTGSRYGLHFMYATGGRVIGNRFERNAAGAYAMYSSDLRYEKNVLAGNHGPSGYGIALKDTDAITVSQNVIAGNRTGIYFDNSPSKPGVTNSITENVIAYNDIGMLFMPSVKHNVLGDNSFIENTQQVAVVTGGDFGGNDWTPGGVGNYWSGYAGYDADGDGFGDLPYTEVSLFHSLLDRHENLRLFVLSPAQSALDLAARAFPVFRPPPTLVDTAPHIQPIPPVIAPPRPEKGALAILATGLVAAAVGTVMWGRGMDAGSGGASGGASGSVPGKVSGAGTDADVCGASDDGGRAS